MKAALCFMISYDHKVNKEELWKKWIEPNNDIINVYFHYKDYDKIQSPWIKEHAIPQQHTTKTSYYHVVQAILSLLSYATKVDKDNQWFCLLTESCVPIISPGKFRQLFFNNYETSIVRCRKAWWNPRFHKRANLRHFSQDFHLGNEPWFILNKEDLKMCFHFIETQRPTFDLICKGGLANESIFAMIFHFYKKLPQMNSNITHLTDWSRMDSATSPHMFKDGDEKDVEFITEQLDEQPFAMFLRKVSPKFPDEILMKFIGTLEVVKDNIVIRDVDVDVDDDVDVVDEYLNQTDNDDDEDEDEEEDEDEDDVEESSGDNDHCLENIDNNYIKNEMDKLTWGMELSFIIHLFKFLGVMILVMSIFLQNQVVLVSDKIE